MNGKVLKLANNDLYGNQDERKVVVFACFNHVKYMNKYVIFSFLGEYDKNKLYYGSIDLTHYITDFTSQYLSRNINPQDYTLIDISNMEKVELVSSNSIDCDKLHILDELSIPKPPQKAEAVNQNKKPTILYILLVILILLTCGLTYLYLFPHAFMKQYKVLTCTKDLYNSEVSLSYKSNKIITFNSQDKLIDIEETDTYIFTSHEKYNEYKNNEKYNEYFDSLGIYKYDDNKLELNVSFKEKTIIDNYEEMQTYLKSEKYTCTEESYYEE